MFLTGTLARVEIDWVPVGDPGNACDPQSQGCFGAVSERGLRGGASDTSPSILAASFGTRDFPGNEVGSIGFRVATVPEPAARVLGLTALLVVALLRGLGPQPQERAGHALRS